MFTFDKSDIQRFAVSSVGAITLTAASLFAAAGPVRAATPVTIADWQQEVASRVEAVREPLRTESPSELTRAQVKIHFTADGDYAGATLARRSGNRSVDARALKVADRVDYPALPAGFRGTPQTVRMNLYFGSAGHVAEYAAIQARTARTQFAAKDGAADQVAAR